MKECDYSVFEDRVEDPKSETERANAIADVLEGGAPTKLFCLILASMIRPDGTKNPTPFKFHLKRKIKGRPKGPDWQVAAAMERMVDLERLSIDAAVFQIQQKFGAKGNSASKCLAALKAARLDRRVEKLLEQMEAENRRKAELDAPE